GSGLKYKQGDYEQVAVYARRYLSYSGYPPHAMSYRNLSLDGIKYRVDGESMRIWDCVTFGTIEGGSGIEAVICVPASIAVRFDPALTKDAIGTKPVMSLDDRRQYDMVNPR